ALDHCQQTTRVEGFCDRVEGAGLLNELASDAIALRAHQDDGQIFESLVLSERHTELIPVHAGHHEVHESELDGGLCELLERIDAILGEYRLVAISFEDRADDVADGQAVIDNQNTGPHERWASSNDSAIKSTG